MTSRIVAMMIIHSFGVRGKCVIIMIEVIRHTIFLLLFSSSSPGSLNVLQDFFVFLAESLVFVVQKGQVVVVMGGIHWYYFAAYAAAAFIAMATSSSSDK